MAQFGIGDIVQVNNPEHAMHGEQAEVIADYTKSLNKEFPARERYYLSFMPKYGVQDTFFSHHLELVKKNTKIRKRVYYTVNYCATVEYDPETEDLEDVISNIDIPEGGTHNSEYQDDSFDAYEVEDA